MEVQKNNITEKEFLAKIEEFFSIRLVNSHLFFVDHWMEILLGGKLSKKWGKPGDFYYFYKKIEGLFESCYQLLQSPEILTILETKAIINSGLILQEQHNLSFFPYHLKEEEQISPIKVIKAVFKKKDLNFYQQTLKEWLAEGLNDNCTLEHAQSVVPLYGNLKKLIVACWLIHERIISKNTFKSISPANTQLNFALTEPFLFDEEEVNDPFAVIGFFFNFTNLSGYREELQKFFMAATNEDLAHESPSTLFFIHNQYISLIQAGYFIVSKNLNYVAKASKHGNRTLGEWLLSVRDMQVKDGEIDPSDETAHILNMQERADPMGYCKQTLTHEKVINLRFGLKEWLDAGLSNKSSIHGLQEMYSFELYLTLQKLTEAFYLIITADANCVLPLKNACDEA